MGIVVCPGMRQRLNRLALTSVIGFTQNMQKIHHLCINQGNLHLWYLLCSSLQLRYLFSHIQYASVLPIKCPILVAIFFLVRAADLKPRHTLHM